MSNTQTRTPTSVLLPTASSTDAGDEVIAQLGPENELLIVHDSEENPVADRKLLRGNVQLIPAGDPGGCFEKTDTIAAGMEAASHHRFVWTDMTASTWTTAVQVRHEFPLSGEAENRIPGAETEFGTVQTRRIASSGSRT